MPLPNVQSLLSFHEYFFRDFSTKPLPAALSLKHVYMRPEVNRNRFEISIWGKISLRFKVTSLSAFTSSAEVKLTSVQISLPSI